MTTTSFRVVALPLAMVLFVNAPACLGQSTPAIASASAGTDSPPLPLDPRLWHNSPPLSLESLEGKGVVFYFFEEESPQCAAGWPQVQKLIAEYEGKPVFFLAVNSGSDPRRLGGYLRQHRVKMAVVSDPTREFESAMGVPKLNPQGEVFALKYRDGGGQTGEIKGADLASAAETALKDAAWRVDPAQVPEPLRRAWKAIELGDFARAARPVNKALEGKDEALLAGAKTLLAAVEEELGAAANAAANELREGSEWSAYKQLEAIERRFGDYELDLVKRVEAKAKALGKTDTIKDELAARRLLDKAITRRSPRDLKRVVAKYPATEAGSHATEMLAQLPR